MRNVAGKLTVFAALLCLIAGAQHSNWTLLLAQKTQEQGYWTDPSTGLMWAARDSEKRMNWPRRSGTAGC
jgi:hypothetical protein